MDTLELPKHQEFKKIPRLSKPCIVTEKIDGTNGLIYIDIEQDLVLAGSKSRWLSLDDDNFGFCAWVTENREQLKGLGYGYHYGEWWGRGIQRGYGLKERRFSLFNVARWGENRPECCSVVPTLALIERFNTEHINEIMFELICSGSHAAPGFMKPEGVVVLHDAANCLFKKTFDGDKKK